MQSEPSGTSAPKRPALLALPVEIMELIVDLLPVESTICLSLTTKYLYYLSSKISLSLLSLPVSRQRLLRLLEEDLPSYIHCEVCNSLYDWTLEVNLGYTCPRTSDKRRAHGFLCAPELGGHLYYMSRELRALILRAHQRGPNFGLHPSYLTYSCELRGWYQTTKTEMNSIHRSLRAKVVRNSLMLRRVEILTFGLPSTSSETRGQLMALERCACEHAQYSTPLIAYCILGHIVKKDFDAGNRCRSSNQFQCQTCATDFRVGAKIVDDVVQIEAVSWQDFGSRYDTRPTITEHFNPDYAWHGAKHLEDAYNRDLEARFREVDPDTDYDEPKKNGQSFLIAQDFRTPPGYRLYVFEPETCCLCEHS